MAPLDLHVLGTPPAFVLSQDQTLDKFVIYSLSRLYTYQLFVSSYSNTNVCVKVRLDFNLWN